MALFAPFTRLPPEIRQMIWELAMEPRVVVLGQARTWRGRTPPLPALQACAEARRHLQRFYTKPFFGGCLTESWVNFEIDHVYFHMSDLIESENDLTLIRFLVIECWDQEDFETNCAHLLNHATALEKVSILLYASAASLPSWWLQWDGMMEEWYYRDDPIHFDVEVVNKGDRPLDASISQHNYFKLERTWRRRRHETMPLDWPADVSDSDDDVDGPGRYRKWKHVDGCSCPGRKAA